MSLIYYVWVVVVIAGIAAGVVYRNRNVFMCSLMMFFFSIVFPQLIRAGREINAESKGVPLVRPNDNDKSYYVVLRGPGIKEWLSEPLLVKFETEIRKQDEVTAKRIREQLKPELDQIRNGDISGLAIEKIQKAFDSVSEVKREQ